MTARPDPPRSWLLPLLAAAAVIGVLSLAFWLRWQYVATISLYVDEFTTLWAARRTLEIGAPIMPSGVLYTRGLLATLITALFVGVGGLTYTVGRLPSVLFGLATIGALLGIGRREWNGRVGWLAALGLALLPEAIVWSSRARFYAQLQFFALLAIWAAFVAVRFDPPEDGRDSEQEPDRAPPWRWHLLFALFFVLALFSQAQMVLLYPPLLLGILLWRGWRYLLYPQVWGTQLIILLAMAVRFLIEIVGQPGFFETIQAERPYVGLILDVQSAWNAYARLFIAPERLPWTLFSLLAVIVGLLALARGGWQPARLMRYHQATLFFALQFLFVLAVVLTLVGGQWRETRYLFLVQPNWLLVSAAGAVWVIDSLLTRAVWRWIVTGVVSVVVVVLFWQPAQIVLSQQVEGYDRVLAFVAEQREAGDRILSPQPPACALVLGEPCDYYAVQKVYEEFVIPKDGVLVDRWSGAPLLNDADQLAEIVVTGPRTWFVTDSFRLATRYDEAFLRTVVEQFDVAFEERGVKALLATGWHSWPQPTIQAKFDPAIRFGPLALTGWSRTDAQPGEELYIDLTWQGAEPIDRQINTSVRLVDSDGVGIAQADGPPARGIIPTNLFFDTPLPDPKTLQLPAELPAGRYRVEVAAYDVATVEPLAPPTAVGWILIGPTPPAPSLEVNAQAQNGLRLVGHDELPVLLRPNEPLPVRLVWSAETRPDADYTLFLQLIGPDGTVIAQQDGPPGGAFYPTTAWSPDETVDGQHSMRLPSTLPVGAYRLIAGLYRADTGARLNWTTGADHLELAAWQVE